MKTTFFTATIIVSLMLLVSATVWEGVTNVVSAKDMPENYSVATNSFPKNSVVDILNLENGKMVRVVVVAGLQTNGLLATLSRNAADAIDLRGNTCRIRMTQPPANIAFANFKLGPIVTEAPVIAEIEAQPDESVSEDIFYEAQNPAAEAEPQSDSAAALVMYTTDEPLAAETETLTALEDDEAVSISEAEDNADEFADYPLVAAIADDDTADVIESADDAAYTYNYNEAQTTLAEGGEAPDQTESEQQSYLAAAVMSNTDDEPSEAVTDNPLLEKGNNSGNLSMVPSEERVPPSSAEGQASRRVVIAPDAFAPEVQPIQPERQTVEYASTSDFSPFQVPLISRLEQGKWYVQVAAYVRPDHVEDEISRIGPGYPVAIQNAGTDTNPMFRILLGPLNKGESGAILQRFKSIGYADAFLRNN